MSSAAVAVTLSAWRRQQKALAAVFAFIALVFGYTTVVNVIERPDGIKIAGFFIALILLVSFLSRLARTTELRANRFEIDEKAQRFLDEAADRGTIRIITNPQRRVNLKNTGVKWRSTGRTTTCRLAIPFCFSKWRYATLPNLLKL